MRFLLAITVARIASAATRLLGRGGGSALPGLVAERLDPAVLAKLARFHSGSVVVTGTNGKTSTTHMLAGILRDGGKRVITNSSGSNLTRGIVSALIGQANWRGRVKADWGVFEVDEATMPAACLALTPKVVVVLNLFRDQLDRYGELDTTARLIGGAIAPLEADIWLNADDPLVAHLASAVKLGQVRYFGVSDAPVQRLAHDWAADSNRCPKCGEALDYSVNYFSHIGHYSCANGHFERPKPQMEIKTDAKGGLYNAYNQLAAVAAAGSLGVPAPEAGADLRRDVFGRQETFGYKGRQLTLLLIKNPTGFNQVIQTFLTDKPGPMMIAVNDNFADGRDVSWLWDVAFEEIGEAQFVASGIRAADLALRLKYADRPASVQEDLMDGVDRLLEQVPEGGSAYILPTYTAMLELRNRLKLKRFQA